MFRFKRFSIEQDRTPMKVGTDGVLLGAWVSVRGDERRVLDIGTGTGLIALMLAQRLDNEDVYIDAVEIDEASAIQARENVAASPWARQVAVCHSDIQSFSPFAKYDLIVTNPPYFVDSLLSPNPGRTAARHTTELSFSDLIASVVRLLNPEGRLSLILPIVESQCFEQEAVGKLRLVRRCRLFGRETLPAKRDLCEYVLNDSTEELQPQESLTIESGGRHQYTAQYRELTREFYLKF